MNLADNSVSARDLVVVYRTARGTVPALDHRSLEVEGGGSVAIMGPSGCGKSTLLGLLGGLARPTSGSVTIGGTEISSLAEKARIQFRRENLGMLYQQDNLMPHLTVEENVGLQLAIARPGEQPDGDVHALLERLGLAALADRLPDQLSGGQRQRAAIARAVIHLPAVILADEPTGSLDPDNAERAIDTLIDSQRKIGATLVLVTHDPKIAARADSIIALEQPIPNDAATDAD
ncbi:ABC transporter ATP-binding protein [Agromyces sp. SYSU K20354]|uniref:ABC transporter ATP-binding protein n=1 Tax=Agromyces cavernae TaxID=2898659 RepID=UPI001E3A14E9|nr:ABC transporter ATP-binding protein [Agromyces cavernae]MCD2442630.1 ABC transporter ATP-binding protein [Agromyces cavernae]